MVSVMSETRDRAATHPSGWWKASDGKWYPPEQQPGVRSEGEIDAATATAMAVGAIVFGAVLPSSGATADVALLLGGTAGAFLVRWWVFGRSYVRGT